MKDKSGGKKTLYLCEIATLTKNVMTMKWKKILNIYTTVSRNEKYLFDFKEVSKQIEKDALAKKAARKNKDIYQNAPEMNVELNPMDIEEKEE